MQGRPERTEAAEFYWRYMDGVAGDDAIAALTTQLPVALELLEDIGEQQSLHRYAPGKWSLRQALSHMIDMERVFAYRALWFGRGFNTPLDGLPEDEAAAAAKADRIGWAAHVEEFRRVRLATISLFEHMPDEAWLRRGVASGEPITVRALAFLAAGHAAHHLQIFRERYMS